MANFPILYNYFKQKTVVGCQDLILSLSGVNDNAETDFGDFSKQLSWRIRCHMQNGFSLLIRDLFGVD
jgi:hypothetical protein